VKKKRTNRELISVSWLQMMIPGTKHVEFGAEKITYINIMHQNIET